MTKDDLNFDLCVNDLMGHIHTLYPQVSEATVARHLIAALQTCLNGLDIQSSLMASGEMQKEATVVYSVEPAPLQVEVETECLLYGD